MVPTWLRPGIGRNAPALTLTLTLSPVWGCGLFAVAYDRFRCRNPELPPISAGLQVAASMPLRWAAAWPQTVRDAAATVRSVQVLHARLSE